MKFSKNQIILLVLNIISFLFLVPFIYFLINSFSSYTDVKSICVQIFSTIAFLVPYFVFIIYSVKLLKTTPAFLRKFKGLTKTQWLISITTILSVIIFLFFTIYGIRGICTTLDGIKGINDGYIISEIYSKEQLLNYFNRCLQQNIFSTFFNVYIFVCYCYSSITLFIKDKGLYNTTTFITKNN